MIVPHPVISGRISLAKPSGPYNQSKRIGPPMPDFIWQYALVFLAAATPWLEIIIVIPVAVGMGLSPLPVTLVSFLGNALPIFGIIALFRRWEARRGPVQRRWSPRAKRVWDRYGLPGVALAGPLITGIHLATVMALALRADRYPTALWMTVSLGLWSALAVTATVTGIEWLSWLLGDRAA